jgi:tripartite-type tricarboxylate transporter receptor subunit TctC
MIESKEDSMPSMKRLERAVAIAAALLAILGSLGGTAAQPYPTRPITMVVPYPAGGLFDALARVLAEPMRQALGQSVVIENIGGAGGSIAVGRVARSAPDGYTLAIGSGDQFVVNAAIYPLQYDVVKDFEPIALLVSGPTLIISKPAVPASNLRELIAWLKANHDKVVQGHNGAGGALHLCGLELQRAAGASWPFIPYRGAAPALQDMIGGRLDVMCPSPASSLGMVNGGLLRAYAVTGASRLASAPTIPTVDEAGLPGLHILVWGGLFAPKGTSKDVIARLNAAVVSALADAAVPGQLAKLGQDIVPRAQQAPEALAAQQRAEIEKWWPIIKAANIKGE